VTSSHASEAPGASAEGPSRAPEEPTPPWSATGGHDPEAARPSREPEEPTPPWTATGGQDPGAAARWLARNAVDVLPEGALRRKLAEGRPLRVKLGIDPTAADIHLGHTVVLQKLREFQELGHRVVLIIGDYTARVGDPSGRSAVRPELDPADIERNADTYQRQAFAVLDPARTEVRHNGQWLAMPAEDLFRLARTATVAQLLARDDFAKRYATGQPISILELLYPLLQGFDSVAVRADVELGGTDQKFNLLLAREIQIAYGQKPQAVLTMPILPGTDGVRRMSKSLGNYVGVSEPAEEIFGKVMRVPDDAMGEWYRLLLDRPLDGRRPPVEAKRALARELAARFQGEEAARRAEERFNRLHVERAQPDEVPEAPLPEGDTVNLPALVGEHFGLSRSEVRRLLAQGGVRLDGRTLDADELDVPARALDGAVLQLGKRRFMRFRSAAPGRG
jgi:tyrosyl-tRNA synthetase